MFICYHDLLLQFLNIALYLGLCFHQDPAVQNWYEANTGLGLCKISASRSLNNQPRTLSFSPFSSQVRKLFKVRLDYRFSSILVAVAAKFRWNFLYLQHYPIACKERDLFLPVQIRVSLRQPLLVHPFPVKSLRTRGQQTLPCRWPTYNARGKFFLAPMVNTLSTCLGK